MPYRSHIWSDRRPEAGESARRVCSCGLVRRTRATAAGYVAEDSADGAVWAPVVYGAACPRRAT